MKNPNTPSDTLPAVLEFAARMEAKLAANRHKGGRRNWLAAIPLDLIQCLQAEITEFYAELDAEAPNAERLANEAADVANFAMMLADWYLTRAKISKLNWKGYVPQ